MAIGLIVLAIATLSGCSQVQEKSFILSCAKDQPALPGQLSPGAAMAIDVSTSPMPLISAPHRIVARCDNAGVVTMYLETPVDTGLSQLSTPLSTAAAHVTYAP